MLPVSLNLAGRLALVIGGGTVAEQKVQRLLAARAQVRVVSPGLSPGLAGLRDMGRIEAQQRPWAPGDTNEAFLTVAATGVADVDAEVAAEVRGAGGLVVVAGAPELGNVHLSAEVRRGPVSIAVSTGGASPALARRVRREVEGLIGPEYGSLAEALAELRERVKGSGLPQQDRARLWDAMVNGPALGLLARGESEHARAALAEALRQALAGLGVGPAVPGPPEGAPGGEQ